MGTRWILKSDDDMIINTISLSSYLHYIEKYYNNQELNRPKEKIIMKQTSKNKSIPMELNKIICYVWYGMPVLRGSPSTGCAKWCVSEEDWPEKEYPTYCSGSAFLIPTHIAPRLYESYFKSRFLWVDDAYISGVLAKTAGVTHRPIHSLYELNHFLIDKNLIKGNKIFCHYPGSVKDRSRWWPLISKKELA